MSAVEEAAVSSVAGPVRHLLSILALPVTNTVVIPAVLLAVFERRSTLAETFVVNAVGGASGLFVGAVVLAVGVSLVVTSIGLFASRGDGTLAPWDPPKKLVISGPYRYVRNPMKAGLIFVLIAEALLLRSPALGVWGAFFATVNVLYIRFSEEPGLRRRFGQSYPEYCAAVPAWLPRLTPYNARLSRAGTKVERGRQVEHRRA